MPVLGFRTCVYTLQIGFSFTARDVLRVPAARPLPGVIRGLVTWICVDWIVGAASANTVPAAGKHASNIYRVSRTARLSPGLYG